MFINILTFGEGLCWCLGEYMYRLLTKFISVALFITLNCFIQLSLGDANNKYFGYYENEVITKWLRDYEEDRTLELIEDFVFVDMEDRRWSVPKGTKIDGASIPRLLWSLIGSPLTGEYREASVIHDYYCQEKNIPSSVVHLMFYHAMRASGVAKKQALVMYIAVVIAGPTWDVEDLRNGKFLVIDKPTVNLADKELSSIISHVEKHIDNLQEGEEYAKHVREQLLRGDSD